MKRKVILVLLLLLSLWLVSCTGDPPKKQEAETNTKTGALTGSGEYGAVIYPDLTADA